MNLEEQIRDIKEQMTPANTLKFLAKTLTGLGATAAVCALMGSSLVGSKGVTKLLMKLGIFVLACKAGDVAENYFKETIDEAEKAFREGMNTSDFFKKAQEGQTNG